MIGNSFSEWKKGDTERERGESAGVNDAEPLEPTSMQGATIFKSTRYLFTLYPLILKALSRGKQNFEGCGDS